MWKNYILCFKKLKNRDEKTSKYTHKHNYSNSHILSLLLIWSNSKMVSFV